MSVIADHEGVLHECQLSDLAVADDWCAKNKSKTRQDWLDAVGLKPKAKPATKKKTAPKKGK